MRKKLALVLLTCLLILTVGGCGDTPAVSTTNEPGSSVSLSQSTETSKEAVSASASASEEKENVEEAEKALIEAFIGGTESVTVEGVNGFTDGTYSLSELVVKHTSDLLSYSAMGFLPQKISYVIADAGFDGKPELFLCLGYRENNEYDMPLEDYIVIKPVDGRLKITKDFVDYYRTSARLNKYGYVEFGGSDSAYGSTMTAGYIDNNGQFVPATVCRSSYGLPLAKLPPDFLPASLQGDESITFIDYDGTGEYSIEAWLIGDTSAYSETPEVDGDWDAYFEKRSKESYYCFYHFVDGQPSNVMPEPDVLEAMNSKGFKVLTEKEIATERAKVLKNANLNDDMLSFDDSEWTDIALTDEMRAIERYNEDFKAFITTGKKAYLVNTEDYFGIEAGEYSFTGLADILSEFLTSYNMPHDWDSADYAFIDAGQDSIMDYVVRYHFADWNGDYEPVDCYAFICNREGGLKILDLEMAEYTDFFHINKNGVISSFAYDTAFASYEAYFLLDKDCNKNLIYSCLEFPNLGEATIPEDALPTGLYQDIHSEEEYKWGGDYSCMIYSFEDVPDYDEEISFEQYYRDIVTKRYYLFYQGESNIGPDEAYEELCRKNGLNIVSKDLIDDLIKNRFKDLGLDYNTYYSDDIWWKPISMG